MHSDIGSLKGQFEEAQARMYRLAESVDETGWITRPSDSSWSIDECVAHLTITNKHYLPLITKAVAASPKLPTQLVQPRFRRDTVGWALSKMMEPPVRLKLPTRTEFVPAAAVSRAATVAGFDEAQAGLIALLRELDGRDPTRLRLTSPFNASLKYSLYSAFHILVAHERRHLWQAEQVRNKLGRILSG